MSDFAAFEGKSAGSAVLELTKPDGTPFLQADGKTPCTITLLGQDSDEYVKQDNKSGNLRLAQGARLKLTQEGLDAAQLKNLVAVTVAWDGIVMGGETLECTPTNVFDFYTRVPLVREQVQKFVEDRANFFKTA